jgi:hypothetical protein
MEQGIYSDCAEQTLILLFASFTAKRRKKSFVIPAMFRIAISKKTWNNAVYFDFMEQLTIMRGLKSTEAVSKTGVLEQARLCGANFFVPDGS